MNTLEAARSALFQITKPVFVKTDIGNRLSFTHHYPEGSQKTAEDVPFAAYAPPVLLNALGDKTFMHRHRLACPYVAGAMANGISSVQMVETMADNGMVGFFGAGGLSLDKIRQAAVHLTSCLKDKPFGFNLIHSLTDAEHEMATVQLYLDHGIRLVSAAAFMRMTPALVYYRIKGIHQTPEGRIVAPNQIIAKVSRIEIARQFFSPPPAKIVNQLLEKNLITRKEADLSRYIPMAQDLTAEADSGGHTDNRPALALLPTMIALKDQFMAQFQYPLPLCVGLAGGIATPESAAAAFGMGAAYILTGSINQSCVEAGISQEVKELLCKAEQADVAMAPAADMFEIGARVQVLKRGTLFALRAEKLYQLYRTYDSFADIPEPARQEIETKFLQTDFETAWQSTRDFFTARNMHAQIDKARLDPKHKMALVFRSYLGQSSQWAIQGNAGRKMDYQIWCGPAMGAFNMWAQNSFLAGPENRKTAELALNLLFGACVITRAGFLKTQGITLPMGTASVVPMEKKEILTLAGPGSHAKAQGPGM